MILIIKIWNNHWQACEYSLTILFYVNKAHIRHIAVDVSAWYRPLGTRVSIALMWVSCEMHILHWSWYMRRIPWKHKTFVQCWTNVEDVWPTLYKCYKNVLCLLDILHSELDGHIWRVTVTCSSLGLKNSLFYFEKGKIRPFNHKGTTDKI